MTPAEEAEIDKCVSVLVPASGCQHGGIDTATLGGVRISAIMALRIRELIYELVRRVRYAERKAETL